MFLIKVFAWIFVGKVLKYFAISSLTELEEVNVVRICCNIFNDTKLFKSQHFCVATIPQSTFSLFANQLV